eukprot:scaffold6021_cov117-Isochrysis_galbana.AAC.25
MPRHQAMLSLSSPESTSAEEAKARLCAASPGASAPAAGDVTDAAAGLCPAATAWPAVLATLAVVDDAAQSVAGA